MDQLEKIESYIDAHQDEYFGELKKFVSYGSTASCPEEREKTRTFIEKRFQKAGIPSERVPIPDGNALRAYGGKGGSDSPSL